MHIAHISLEHCEPECLACCIRGLGCERGGRGCYGTMQRGRGGDEQGGEEEEGWAAPALWPLFTRPSKGHAPNVRFSALFSIAIVAFLFLAMHCSTGSTLGHHESCSNVLHCNFLFANSGCSALCYFNRLCGLLSIIILVYVHWAVGNEISGTEELWRVSISAQYSPSKLFYLILIGCDSEMPCILYCVVAAHSIVAGLDIRSMKH